MKRLAIIDGKSVFYRGYYAMPNLATREGTPTGGVYGFATMSLELIKRYKPDYVCVAWDKAKTNIRRRREIYPGYKAGRKPAPPDFYAQIPLLRELLEALNWPLYELDDFEADDIMGSLARQAEAAGLETMLISSDLDMLQCLAPNTNMYALKRGFSDIERFDPAYFEEKYGLKVAQFLDLKSLKGDSSDSIPGVPGVGEKSAVKLLQQYSTLDGVYQNIAAIPGSLGKKLIAGKDSAYLSKQVATIMFDAPLKLDLAAMDIRDLDNVELQTLLKKLEFTKLLNNLPDHMSYLVVADTTVLPGLALEEFSPEFKAGALMADQVLLQSVGDELYLSYDQETFALVSADDVADIVKNVALVTHDGHALCHRLLDHSIELPRTLFDLRQVGFLINSLAKSGSIANLTGYKGDDVAVMMSGLWHCYQTQQQELAKLPKISKIASEIDLPLIPILARMEHRGMLLDQKRLAEMNIELSHEIAATAKQMFESVGYEFNIASPAQLAEVLYTKLQLSTVGIKRGKTGYSTGQKELDKLRGQHPIIELIERYRELSKLQNTYVSALPKLADSQSRLHTTFNQDVASTGRLSSSDPNLQNIPIRTEQGRKIRRAFVPAAGNVFVSADYSQFELRLAAVLSGDQEMIDSFNAGADIHTKTAADLHGVAPEDVTKNMRRDAKVINFGILYGMGPHALADNTGMSFVEARKFIDRYFELRYKVREYLDNILRQARDEGYVETYYGRRRLTPDVKSSNFVVRSAAERAAMNMPIQGTEADLVKRAMIAVEGELAGGPSPDGPGEPFGVQILQIHDSILVECPRENADTVSRILRETMENIAPELPIKLKVDVTAGDNWGEV